MGATMPTCQTACWHVAYCRLVDADADAVDATTAKQVSM